MVVTAVISSCMRKRLPRKATHAALQGPFAIECSSARVPLHCRRRAGSARPGRIVLAARAPAASGRLSILRRLRLDRFERGDALASVPLARTVPEAALSSVTSSAWSRARLIST